MRALSAAELLDVCERSFGRPIAERALELLVSACPEVPRQRLASLSVGRRNALLLRLRNWTFGPELTGLTACPECGAQVELNWQVGDLLTGGSAAEAMEGNEADDGTARELIAGPFEVTYRLPNSWDLIAIGHLDDVAAGRELLLRSCLLDVRRDGEQCATADLPDDVVKAVIERMSEEDPWADVQLAFCCPFCEHRSAGVLDIVSYFCREIERWSRRMLYEVHILASRYGWREADILRMSAWRRHAYLQLAGQ